MKEQPAKSPYPGLRPFERNEARIFFGRDKQIDELLDRLKDNHFLAVLGTSGCGKSSLIKAGLIPGLLKGYMGEVGTRWIIAEMRPEGQPFTSLAEALLKDETFSSSWNSSMTDNQLSKYSGYAAIDSEHVLSIEAELRRSEKGAHNVLELCSPPKDTNILILADQFEEIFRFHKKNESDAKAFVELIIEAATHKNVYVVMTMRSEYLGQCTEFYRLPEAINKGLYLTPQLTVNELKEAISYPAKLFDGDVEKALVVQLLNESSRIEDSLPLLQHALMRLWDSDEDKILTLQEFYDFGPSQEKCKLKDILSYHVNSVCEELIDENKKKITKNMFRLLAEVTKKGEYIRRPTKLKEIINLSKSSKSEVLEVISHYKREGRNFLVLSAKNHEKIINEEGEYDENTVVDISHESLIRQWKQLREWIDNETTSANQYKKLVEASTQYENNKRELLDKLELGNALDWENRENPTSEWARRYGGSFKKVMDFVEQSHRGISRKKRKKRATVTLTIAGLLLTTGWALLNTYNIRNKKNELNNKNIELIETQKEIDRANDILSIKNENLLKAQSAINKQKESAEHIIGTVLFKKDLEERRKYFNKKKGEYTYATIALAEMYEKGIGGKLDIEKSIQLYDKASQSGNADAKILLAKIYYEGHPKDGNDIEKALFKEKALRLFAEGIEKGPKFILDKSRTLDEIKKNIIDGKITPNAAQFIVAELYEKGRGVQKDQDKAISLYEVAKEKGSADATNKLGEIYSGNIDKATKGDAKKLTKKAAKLFKEAGELGSSEAKKNLGKLYLTPLRDIEEKNQGVLLAHNNKQQPEQKNQEKEAAKLFDELSDTEEDAETLTSLGLLYRYGRGGKPQDFNKAIEYYKKAAKLGSYRAMTNLGAMYEYGLGDQGTNYQLAAENYEKAAIEGYARAQNNLGWLIENGWGRKTDYTHAAELYASAAEQDYTRAKTNLGRLYQYGLGVEKRDIKKAFNLFTEARQLGDARAYNQLGEVYLNSDKEKAIEYFEIAAKRNDPKALYNLSKVYKEGSENTPKDEFKYTKYLAAAARNGNSNAQQELVEKYKESKQYGKALRFQLILENKKTSPELLFDIAINYEHEKAYDKAIEFYKKAANKNSFNALNKLGYLYKKGKLGLNPDYKKSLDYYKQAADLDHTYSLTLIGQLYHEGKVGKVGNRRNYKTAAKYFKRAAELGDSSGQYYLGTYYENNHFRVKKDLDTAKMWFEKAAKQGHKDAIKKLKRLNSQ